MPPAPALAFVRDLPIHFPPKAGPLTGLQVLGTDALRDGGQSPPQWPRLLAGGPPLWRCGWKSGCLRWETGCGVGYGPLGLGSGRFAMCLKSWHCLLCFPTDYGGRPGPSGWPCTRPLCLPSPRSSGDPLLQTDCLYPHTALCMAPIKPVSSCLVVCSLSP